VSSTPSPIVRRRRLGSELRRLRETAGLTGDQVIELLGWASASKLSRLENGKSRPALGDVEALLRVYDVEPPEYAELLNIAREAAEHTRAWLRSYSAMTSAQREYAELEAGCAEICEYAPVIVPGLLQTAEYAETMIRAARPDITADEVERRVRVRLGRQSLLSQDDPIDLWVVLDEAVLSRPVGGDAVMRAQLERLVEAAALPNVTLQILPFEAGAHAGMDGTFAILDFPEQSDPAVVYAENATGGLFLEKAEELRKYDFIFDHIRAAALRPEESASVIAKLAKEPLWTLRPGASGSI